MTPIASERSTGPGAWGPGGLAVIVVPIAARRLTRYRLRQSPLRPALTFCVYAVVLSAFVFALLAMGRVPALTSKPERGRWEPRAVRDKDLEFFERPVVSRGRPG